MSDIEVQEASEKEVITAAFGGRVFMMQEGCVEAVELVPVGASSGLAYVHLFTIAGHAHKYIGPIPIAQARKIARFFLVKAVKDWKADESDDDTAPVLDEGRS